MPQFWYNVKTHQVEEDAISDWTSLLGPYDSREQAEQALTEVAKRNAAWDADDDG